MKSESIKFVVDCMSYPEREEGELLVPGAVSSQDGHEEVIHRPHLRNQAFSVSQSGNRIHIMVTAVSLKYEHLITS